MVKLGRKEIRILRWKGLKDFNIAKEYTINYKNPVKVNIINSEGKQKTIYLLGAQNKIIKNSTKKCGYVYFIIDNDKVLYVGSSTDANGRLSRHLISNRSYPKTQSQIKNVYEFLNETKKTLLKYKIIEIEPWYYHQAVEHLLINHFRKINKDLWNIRK